MSACTFWIQNQSSMRSSAPAWLWIRRCQIQLRPPAPTVVVVVRSSRVNGGIIRRNIEVNDDQMGTVASMELNPAKARVLLQLALIKTKDAKQVQGFFDRY